MSEELNKYIKEIVEEIEELDETERQDAIKKVLQLHLKKVQNSWIFNFYFRSIVKIF